MWYSLIDLSSVKPHSPCSLQSGPGSPACIHWLCGSSIRWHYSSSHPSRLHSHLWRHTDSPQKCSARWSTWRRSHCTSFLKRTKDGCQCYRTAGFLRSALDLMVDTLIALRKSPPPSRMKLAVSPPLVTLMKRAQLRAKQQLYLPPDIWGSEAVRQSGRDSRRSRHTPTESWGGSGRPRSETPLIRRSGTLEKKETFSLCYQCCLCYLQKKVRIQPM